MLANQTQVSTVMNWSDFSERKRLQELLCTERLPVGDILSLDNIVFVNFHSKEKQRTNINCPLHMQLAQPTAKF